MPQDDDWYQQWARIVSGIMNAWDMDKKCWRYFPFNGGLYDQALINPVTWSIWEFVVAKWYEVILNSEDR